MQSVRIYEMPACKMVSSGTISTDIDQKTDRELMNTEIDRFLSENGFERDTSRSELGNIITSPLVKKIMGYEQMDYYIPIKAK